MEKSLWGSEFAEETSEVEAKKILKKAKTPKVIKEMTTEKLIK